MKTLLTSIALFAAGLCAQAQIQTPASHTIELKTNPIGFAFGVYNISVEKPILNQPTLTFNTSAWLYSNDLKEWTGTEQNGGFSMGIRKYAGSDVNSDQNLYLGLASRYISRNSYNYSTRKNVSSDYASLGFTIGYKKVFDKVSIDVFTGLGRKLYKQNPYTWDIPVDFMGGFNFGYRF